MNQGFSRDERFDHSGRIGELSKGGHGTEDTRRYSYDIYSAEMLIKLLGEHIYNEKKYERVSA